MTQAETPVARISFELQPTGAPAIADHGALQGLGDDDHPQYLTGARAAAIFSQKTETAAAVAALQVSIDAAGAGAASALAAHTSAADPHVNYLNQQRGDARYERSTNRNAPDGYAGLDVSGKVPASLLPSYVDDVLEHASTGTLPLTGETGKIYVTLDSGKTYRWSGSSYVEISAAPGSTDSVPEGAANLYHTAARVNALIATAVGVSVQAYNATLSALSGLATQAFGRGLLNLASAAALRTAIALPVATSAGRLARYTDVNGSQGETGGLFEDTSGNVGIGTSAPNTTLHVNGVATFGGPASQGTINVNNTTGALRGAVYTDGTDIFLAGSGGSTGIQFRTASANRMRIDSSGNVGIGTTTPQRPLDISVSGTSYGQGGYAGGTAAIFRSTASPASNSRISITSGNVGVSIIDFGDTDGDRGSLQYIHNGDALAFSANAVERMRIDGSGNVGVGTNAPTARLDNAGDTYRQRTTRTPASSSAAGNFGDICWDANYLYICVATNTWKRSALATW